jgi:hypothetical protein
MDDSVKKLEAKIVELEQRLAQLTRRQEPTALSAEEIGGSSCLRCITRCINECVCGPCSPGGLGGGFGGSFGGFGG